MKRILSLLLALTLVFALVACSNEKDTTSEPDTSTTQTETESTDTNDTQTSETDTDESSSDTETPSNSTPTTSTETSKPTTSDNDNTTSSKPSNTTSTPTTSSPTETNKPTSSANTPTHTHNWSVDWKTETKALVGKDGTEKRTCSGCKEVEKRSTKANAAYNSFWDCYLDEYFAWFVYSGNQTTFDISALFKCGDLIARDECPITQDSTIAVNDYYKALKEHFVLNDAIISQMKSQRNADVYPITMDGFTSQPFDTVVGYTHNGGNKYTVYWKSSYRDDVKPIKVELEYNLLNGKPNRYISIEFVNSIPNNIVK